MSARAFRQPNTSNYLRIMKFLKAIVLVAAAAGLVSLAACSSAPDPAPVPAPAPIDGGVYNVPSK